MGNDLDHGGGPWFELAVMLRQEVLLHLGRDFVGIGMSVSEIVSVVVVDLPRG